MPDWPGTLQVLVPEEEIEERVREIGRRITKEYKNKLPLLVCVLRGATIFHSDLIRQIHCSLEIDFISVSSYGATTETSGAVKLVKDLEESIESRHVILVEDIVDTGLTLNYLLANLRSRRPASLKVCALLSKPARRRADVAIDFLGFEIPNHFVVGYGLDHDQQYRNLHSLMILDPALMS